MTHPITDNEVAELIRRVDDAASALMAGDIRTYVGLVHHADDYTLFAPNGGEPRRGFDNSEDALDALAQTFNGGEATLEVLKTYASGDIAVLVAIERQHGVVSGLPEQDWSLRTTLVFRREGLDWRLLHRHADPLVHPIKPELFTAIARGDHQAS
jgi:ketosteroid isomerase-like protein